MLSLSRSKSESGVLEAADKLLKMPWQSSHFTAVQLYLVNGKEPGAEVENDGSEQ